MAHFRAVNPQNTKQVVFSSMEGCLGTLEAMTPLCRRGNLKKAIAANKIT